GRVAPRLQPAARPLDGPRAGGRARADAGAGLRPAHGRDLELQRHDPAHPRAARSPAARRLRARLPGGRRREAAAGDLRARARAGRRDRGRGGVRRRSLLHRRPRRSPRRYDGRAPRSRPVLGRARLSVRAHRAGRRQAVARMYLSRELWRFTAGVRWRIAWAVLIGLAAVVAGIARLALLGWLLARVLAGPTLPSLLFAVGLVAAVTVLRGALEYYRTMVAHHTAALVQATLRRTLYAHITALGPAHFGRSRTGDVVLSMVEGIQQLEVYFGQYLPQLAVACLTPVLIFAFVAFIDLPVALVTLVAALVTLGAPVLWHRRESLHSLARNKAYAAYGAEFLDTLQGLATLKAFGQSAARRRLLEDKGRARGARAGQRRGAGRHAHAERRLRGGDVRLSRRSRSRPRAVELLRRARRADRARGTERLGQVHRRAAAAALLRSPARPDPGRRPRRARAESRRPARAGRDRAPGHLPVPRDGRGQSPDRQARRHP